MHSGEFDTLKCSGVRFAARGKEKGQQVSLAAPCVSRILRLLLADCANHALASAAGRGWHANRAGIRSEGVVVGEPPVDCG